MNALRKQFLALRSNNMSYTALTTLEVAGNLMSLPSCHLLPNRTGEDDLFKKQGNYQDKEIEPVSSFFMDSGK